MPRGGSKKGEHRGGAKPGRKGFQKGHKLARGRPAGSTNKPKFDPNVAAILNNDKISVAERERRIESYFMITGRRTRMPREVMLDAMRFFEEQAIDYHEIMEANMELAATAPTDEAKAIYEQHVTAAEAKLNQSLSMAVDVAYKAAPFCHPRLAAVVTNPAGDAKNPMNVLALLMQELDEAGKPPRFIDHDASEVVR